MSLSDYALGRERAASEAEYMKRGYAAWLMGDAQGVADLIRSEPAKGTSYRDALKAATALAIRMREGAKNPSVMALHNDIAERLNNIPDDPLDESHCSRRDGQLPTTSRGYVR